MPDEVGELIEFGAVSRRQPGVPRTRVLPRTSRANSDTRVDITLLACALFLQRIDLPIGKTLLELDLVLAVLIIFHQFFKGHLSIDYDRLLWFVPLGLATACSLLINFRSNSLPSYGLFVVSYLLFLFSRPCTTERYRETLRGFQFLATLIAIIAVVQFAAQFVIDGRQLIHFYGLIPDNDRWNTIITIGSGSLIKSNGLFLVEPSALSQMMGLAILIEILEFGRLRNLILLGLGWLFSYGGTGLTLVLVFLPLAAMRQPRARVPALCLVIFAVALIATGIVDMDAFTGRVSEFDNTKASGFARFVAPFLMTSDHLDTASLPVLLLGSGPGTTEVFTSSFSYTANASTWFKLFYEYELIGLTTFILFFGSTLKRSMCPPIALAAILFIYVFLGGQLVSISILIPIIVLCTLNKPENRGDPIHMAAQYQPFGSAGSAN